MITIIEPHSDDAWLGMGGHMISLKDQFKIITLCKNEKDNKTEMVANAYPHITNVFLDLPDIPWSKEHREEINGYSSLEAYYEAKHGISVKQIREMIKPHLEGTTMNCMGYRHPFHNLISNAIETDYYYAEYPYFHNRKSWCVHIKSPEYTLSKELDVSKVKSEWNYILNFVYKNQIKTFWFFRPYYKNHDKEALYIKKEIKNEKGSWE
jgi:hypothetical protein